MDPFIPPFSRFPSQNSQSSTMAVLPPNQLAQIFILPINEQILWTRQRQMLHEQQTATLQMYYAQQAQGLTPNIPIQNDININQMITSQFSNRSCSLATDLPSLPALGVCDPTAVPSLFDSFPFRYPVSQHLPPLSHQPPPLAVSHTLTMRPHSQDVQLSAELFAKQPSSPIPMVTNQERASSTSTNSLFFTGVDDLILANALSEHDSSEDAICSLADTRGHSIQEWKSYYDSKCSTIERIIGDLKPTRDDFTPCTDGLIPHTASTADIPGIPRKEPSPSTKLVPHGGGNKYTEEDDEYFTQYVLWRISRDVDTTKIAICQALCVKAPHHSLESWKTYWWSRDKDIERVRGLIKGGTLPKGFTSFKVTSVRLPRDRFNRSVSPVIQVRKRRQPLKLDDEIYRKCGIHDFELSFTDSHELEKVGNLDHGEKRISTAQHPIAYTKSDFQAVVRSLIEYPNLSSGARWDRLSKQRPAHTSKAWGEYYRRNQDNIDRRVRHLKKRVDKKLQLVLQDEPASGFRSGGHQLDLPFANHFRKESSPPTLDPFPAASSKQCEPQPSNDHIMKFNAQPEDRNNIRLTSLPGAVNDDQRRSSSRNELQLHFTTPGLTFLSQTCPPVSEVRDQLPFKAENQTTAGTSFSIPKPH